MLDCGLLRGGYHLSSFQGYRVDLHEVGPVCLSGLDGVDAEATFQSGSNLLRVEVGAPTNADEWEVALGLPFPKGPESGTGGLAWEEDFDAVFCADELRMLW
jgi:hypothetical protein